MGDEQSVQMSETADQQVKQMLKLDDDKSVPQHIVVAWNKAKRYQDRIGAGGEFGPQQLAILVSTAELVAAGVTLTNEKGSATGKQQKVRIEDVPDVTIEIPDDNED